MKNNTGKKLEKLLETTARLRSPEGCIWDRQQDHSSLIKYLEEESLEVIEAINQKDMNSLKDELGDLLFQVVFHCQIAKENGFFNMGDVIQTLEEKLIRRHPHVFGNVKAETVEEILDNWNKIKQQEKKGKISQ